MTDNNLWFLREYNNMGCAKVAEKIGVSPSTYSQWEHSRIAIPTRRLVDLANFYDINIDYIMKLTTVKRRIRTKTTIDLIAIGARIKEIRKSLGLSLRDLGKELNYSFSALSSYERGQYLVQSDILITLSKKTNYSIDWILGRKKQKYISDSKPNPANKAKSFY